MTDKIECFNEEQIIKSINDYYNDFKNHYNKKYRHVVINENDTNNMNKLNMSFSLLINDYIKTNKITNNILNKLIELIYLKLKHHELLFDIPNILDIISNDKQFITYENLIRVFNIDTYKYLKN